ncbi:transmembrane protein 208-like isoform X3 [Rhodamnia argentea]|uniref:Transmembrane protein 208-like isoform X3 n=1 Tax=Rhodamnia argentea TaxID=178133 RepID=A0ABM3H1Y6_9MYRT|nr:transmembrane protein 208-like isoform X3 [Rhodamnia argentea]
MANQGAKKRKEENARHMARLRYLIIACNVIYILVRMLIFHSSFTWKHWIGLLVTSAAYAIPYLQLAKLAKPTYANDGELLDGGFDMSTGGVCEYLHDLIFITSFVQVASIISGKFWYTYLVDALEDDKTRKKREKMEKRASRNKFVKTRAR